MKQKFYATLDRIEGSRAILIAGDEGDTLEISRKLLPDDCKEGDMLSVTLEKKDKKTRSEKERVEKLIKKLSS